MGGAIRVSWLFALNTVVRKAKAVVVSGAAVEYETALHQVHRGKACLNY